MFYSIHQKTTIVNEQDLRKRIDAHGGDMPLCVIMCGLPCSGKTRLRNFMIERGTAENIKLPVVASSDDVIDRLAADADKTYSEIFNEVASEANVEYNNTIKRAIAANNSLIIDRTTVDQKSLDRIAAAVSRDRYMTLLVKFDKPKSIDQWIDVVDARGNEIGKTIPHDVLRSMYDRFFDTINDIDTTNIDVIVEVPLWFEHQEAD